MATESTRAWTRVADEAIAAKSDAAFGERGQRVAEAARRVGTTPALARKAVSVRLALMNLESRIMVPDIVWALPVGIAEVVARWAARDPVNAFAAAQGYSENRLTFEAVVSAERAARPGRDALRAPGTPDPVAAWRAAQLAGLARGSGRKLLAPAADDLPVSAWLHDESGSSIGVLVVGPYDTPAHYLAHRASACVSAVGIARLAGRALLVVPSEETRLRYAAWLRDRSVAPAEVHVESIRPSARLKQRTKRLRQQQDAQPPAQA